jgi:hypothetical protein
MLSSACHCRLFFVCSAMLAPAIALTQSPGAPVEEVREYEVLVKQSPAGKVSTTIAQAQDGTTVAVTDTTVDAKFFLIKYHYEYHGKESWRGERLVRLESHTNDDGKKLAVLVAVDASGSRIDVQGKPVRSGPILAMTSNYWRLPDFRLATGNFAIIDSDTGTLFNVRIQRLGVDSVVVGGRNIACDHYRISGDTAAELWFDGGRRLVRQQTVEQGYPTELRLVRITANAAAR